MRKTRRQLPSIFCVAMGIAFVGACASDDNDVSVDAAQVASDATQGNADAKAEAIDAQAGEFQLTSNSIVEGGVIAIQFSCQGSNISPALAWANPPEGTQAFALVFKDLSIDFLHSAMWDIPVDRMELPEDVDKLFEPGDVPGAKQPNSYLNNVRGYAGPCPGEEHTYELRVHAVDAATLSGLGQQSTRAQVVAAIEAASLGSAALSASFNPNL